MGNRHMALLKGPFSEKDALLHEWALANPEGGFAASSIAFANTRKQHGLLVAENSNSRTLLMAKLEETMAAGGRKFSLSTSQYKGAVHPDGYTRLAAFSSSPLPTFQYREGDVAIEKTIFPAGRKNAFGARYAVFSSKAFSMEIRPMLNFRKMNGITQGKPGYDVQSRERAFLAKCNGMAATVQSDRCGFLQKEEWYDDFFYARDSERQTECTEHCFSPGAFHIESNGSAEFFIVACEGDAGKINAHAAFEAALARADAVSGAGGKGKRRDEFLSTLLLAADSFVSKQGGRTTIIAGYPWFSEWGRDSMISLPGLLLCTGRHEEAREVLARFAAQIKDGQLPNFIGEGGAPAYNSADASLWFAHAAGKYVDASHDKEFVEEIFLPAMRNIVEGYAHGTENGIAVDGDGLVIAGKKGSNLTWMDTLFEDGTCPVPRWGKPVEINALWYSSLRLSEAAFRRADGKFADRCAGLARKCCASFHKFWNSDQQCLFDVIEPESNKVRPNQIFAVSLPYSPLGKAERVAVFRKVTEELLTPVGLRTLSPKDPDFRAAYRGNMKERDAAYHNGCVWPWLMGAYIDAGIGLGATHEESLALLQPFKKQLASYGVGSLPEIYDGGTLRPDGCISQAWSVAEILRKYVELG